MSRATLGLWYRTTTPRRTTGPRPSSGSAASAADTGTRRNLKVCVGRHGSRILFSSPPTIRTYRTCTCPGELRIKMVPAGRSSMKNLFLSSTLPLSPTRPKEAFLSLQSWNTSQKSNSCPTQSQESPKRVVLPTTRDSTSDSEISIEAPPTPEIQDCSSPLPPQPPPSPTLDEFFAMLLPP